MTIYVVTSGEYSDYGINAVFTSREQAELYCATHNDNSKYGYQCEVEEYEADTPVLEGKVYHGIRFTTSKKRVEYTENIYSARPVVPKITERLYGIKDDCLIEIPTNQAYTIEEREKIAKDYLAKIQAEKEGL